MPSGKNHDRITFFCLPCLVPMALILTHKLLLTFLITGSFLFSGLMFGPDLDIYSIQFKRWGPLRWLWLPYQKILAHRSFFSHGFIIGTTIRIIYLCSFILLCAIFTVAILQFIWGFDWNWQKFVISSFVSLIGIYRQEAIAILVGLELGAMSHYLADWMTSFLKKINNPQLSLLNRRKNQQKQRKISANRRKNS